MAAKPPIESHADLIHAGKPEGTRLVRAADVFLHGVEQFIYAALGILLAVTAMVALAGAAGLVWSGAQDWKGTGIVFQIIDRSLFVLMLSEIIYTIRVSMLTGALSSEPFLVVALIACIRRILLISLETSHVTRPETWSPQNAALFHAAMTELSVLAGLVIVMVGAIVLVRRFAGG